MAKYDTTTRKEQIVTAALAVVAAQGMKGLQVTAVARMIGMVPSALYRHFANKHAIVEAILDHIESRLQANIQEVCAETADPWDRLYRLLMRHARLIAGNHGIPKVIFSEEVYGGSQPHKERLYGLITSYLATVATIANEGQAGGSIRADVSPERIALMFLGILQPAAILWDVSDGQFDFVSHADEAWCFFKEGLQPRSNAEDRTDIA